MKKLTRAQFVKKFKSVELLALDVDGVLTNDTIFVGPEGLELKQFHISDGFFMTLAIRSGLQIVIVSARASNATTQRMTALGVTHILQGNENKVALFAPLQKELGISFDRIAYVGNELLDIPLAQKVGLPIAVADAAAGYKSIAAYVTKRKGGEAAVREILECYFESIQKDPMAFTVYGR